MANNQHCDKCGKTLQEETTFDYIMCDSCNTTANMPPKQHCAMCGTSIILTDILSKMKKFLPKLKIPGIIAGVLGVVALGLRVISKTIAIKFLLGVCGIILAILALALGIVIVIGVFWFSFVGTFLIANAIRKKLNLDLPNAANKYYRNGGRADDGTVIFFTFLHWFAGVVIVGSPFLVYLFGNMLYKFFQ
jgi:hypothetical protein